VSYLYIDRFGFSGALSTTKMTPSGHDERKYSSVIRKYILGVDPISGKFHGCEFVHELHQLNKL